MIEVSRTLMKSEPELAELVESVEGLEVTMAEKGFGTRVALRASEQSGYGKDLSVYALEDYTEIKHVMVNLD